MENADLFDEVLPISGNALGGLLGLSDELLRDERELADLNALVRVKSGRITELKTQIIPDKMAELGISEFATPQGDRLKVEDFVSGAMPKEPEARDSALRALEEWGAEGVIRNEMLLTFEKSEHNEALALADELRGRGYPVEVRSGVHSSTYLATIRERLAGGGTVDADRMGVFIGRKTKVTLAKEGKR